MKLLSLYASEINTVHCLVKTLSHLNWSFLSCTCIQHDITSALDSPEEISERHISLCFCTHVSTKLSCFSKNAKLWCLFRCDVYSEKCLEKLGVNCKILLFFYNPVKMKSFGSFNYTSFLCPSFVLSYTFNHWDFSVLRKPDQKIGK